MIKVYNRASKRYEQEKVVGGKALDLLYGTSLGRTLLVPLVKRRFVSAFYGFLMDRSLSRRLIPTFIRNNHIDMTESGLPLPSFRTFNEFFHRPLKPEARPSSKDPRHLISPADARLLVETDISKDAVLQVKGLTYSLEELLQDGSLAKEFQGGTSMAFRLCPLDYHRFHFFDHCTAHVPKAMKGAYYSVNPIALATIPRLYLENKRCLTVLETDHFGKVLYLEVGATNVGSIIQSFDPGKPQPRGGEKGYFKFGGSTVLLFFKKDALVLDPDIVEHSRSGVESRVLFGETLGYGPASSL